MEMYKFIYLETDLMR